MLDQRIVPKLLRSLQKDLKSVASALEVVSRQPNITAGEQKAIRSISRKVDRLSLDVLMAEDLLEQGRTEEII